MPTRISTLILLAILASNCNDQIMNNTYLLPDNGKVTAKVIGDFSVVDSLQFAQYEGFFITISDSIINKLFVIAEKHEEQFNSVLSSKQIEDKKKIKVKFLRSNKLPKSIYSKRSITNYLAEQYIGMKFIKAKSDNPLVENQLDGIMHGSKVLDIQEITLGIPGFFINIYPTEK